MSDEENIMLSILREQSSKLDKIQDDIGDMKTDIAINTKDLTEHKEGVIQNRGAINTHRSRLDKIEQPLSVKAVAKWVISVGAVAAAIITIIKLVGG